MLSLSLMLKDLQRKITNLEIGGTSTVEFDTSKIKIGTVSYHDGKPTINLRYDNGDVYFDFVLTNPITDAKQFGTVVVNSMIHHVIDRIPLTAVPKTTFTLTEKPNECPIVITVGGFSYHETKSSDDIFEVNREYKQVTWYTSKSGITLDNELADTIYVSYEVSDSVSKQRENIDISQIIDNSFAITKKPNNTSVIIYINGVAYFEDNNDFTVNRAIAGDSGTTAVPIIWNSEVTGFSLDSSLTGYITVLYEIDI